jgi:hypothetical protein
MGPSASSPASAAEATASIGGPTWVSIYRNIATYTDLASYQHPGSFRLTSADSFVAFRHLRWRGWNGQRAVAHGRAKTCGEGGIEGYICRTGRVRLAADLRAECGHGYVYLRLIAYKIPDYGPEIEVPLSPTRCP